MCGQRGLCDMSSLNTSGVPTVIAWEQFTARESDQAGKKEQELSGSRHRGHAGTCARCSLA